MNASSDFVSNVRTNSLLLVQLLSTLNEMVTRYQLMGYAASLPTDSTAFQGTNANQNATSIANYIAAIQAVNAALAANSNAALMALYTAQA